LRSDLACSGPRVMQISRTGRGYTWLRRSVAARCPPRDKSFLPYSEQAKLLGLGEYHWAGAAVGLGVHAACTWRVLFSMDGYGSIALPVRGRARCFGLSVC